MKLIKDLNIKKCKRFFGEVRSFQIISLKWRFFVERFLTKLNLAKKIASIFWYEEVAIPSTTKIRFLDNFFAE